ncbi:hypothetical protein VNO78_17932 [Psophocarpus tetragonolobus]|uniref:t-SNARE coiled-coil homology domain-containing protein n=1 Tax=Psophocarpus tetragonolobus TaxID=3891 RepID=A0AAN9SHK2_PSOTE
MNDLFSTTSSFRGHHDIEMIGDGEGEDGGLEKFFGDVEAIKEELNQVERLKRNLKSSHEHTKTLHKANAVKEIRSSMEADVALALKKAKVVKLALEALERANADHRSVPGCEAGSSSDRSRTAVVVALWKKLKDSLEGFNGLRHEINSEYRETVQRRYFTVTGHKPDDKTLDLLISTGESEVFLQKAIEEQGRVGIEDTIIGIKERHDGMKELENNLKELHQVFLDMAVLIQSQGEQLDNIESHLARANSFVRNGIQQLQTASKHKKKSKKCICYALVLFLVVVLIVLLVLFTLRPWEHV